VEKSNWPERKLIKKVNGKKVNGEKVTGRRR
jgi:hypothetical protein